MNSDDSQIYSFFEALTHPLRVKILLLLHENNKMTYSQLLESLGVDTGKLNFHFKKLGALIEKTEDGFYKLTGKGILAISAIQAVREHLGVGISLYEHFKSFTGRRLGAWFLDIILVYVVAIGSIDFTMIPVMIPFLSYTVLIPAMIYKPLTYLFSFNLLTTTSTEQVISIYYRSILWIYWTMLEGYRGQSIGKMLFEIRNVKTDGSPVQLTDSAITSFGKAFLLPLDILLGIGLKIRKKGYFLRFTEYYTHVATILTKLPL
ncbi:MAG: RDD family protein [Candidatus Asgardarchaeia archaeon]